MLFCKYTKFPGKSLPIRNNFPGLCRFSSSVYGIGIDTQQSRVAELVVHLPVILGIVRPVRHVFKHAQDGLALRIGVVAELKKSAHVTGLSDSAFLAGIIPAFQACVRNRIAGGIEIGIELIRIKKVFSRRGGIAVQESRRHEDSADAAADLPQAAHAAAEGGGKPQGEGRL